MRTLFFAVLILGIFRTPLNSSRILSMSCCLFILFFSLIHFLRFCSLQSLFFFFGHASPLFDEWEAPSVLLVKSVPRALAALPNCPYGGIDHHLLGPHHHLSGLMLSALKPFRCGLASSSRPPWDNASQDPFRSHFYLALEAVSVLREHPIIFFTRFLPSQVDDAWSFDAAPANIPLNSPVPPAKAATSASTFVSSCRIWLQIFIGKIRFLTMFE